MFFTSFAIIIPFNLLLFYYYYYCYSDNCENFFSTKKGRKSLFPITGNRKSRRNKYNSNNGFGQLDAYEIDSADLYGNSSAIRSRSLFPKGMNTVIAK